MLPPDSLPSRGLVFHQFMVQLSQLFIGSLFSCLSRSVLCCFCHSVIWRFVFPCDFALLAVQVVRFFLSFLYEHEHSFLQKPFEKTLTSGHFELIQIYKQFRKLNVFPKVDFWSFWFKLSGAKTFSVAISSRLRYFFYWNIMMSMTHEATPRCMTSCALVSGLCLKSLAPGFFN